MEHHKLRRQPPIPPYVADFACVAKKMIVELDGRGHHLTVEHDPNRDTVLEEQSWHLLRFQNGQLLRDREGVLRTILHHLKHSS